MAATLPSLSLPAYNSLVGRVWIPHLTADSASTSLLPWTWSNDGLGNHQDGALFWQRFSQVCRPIEPRKRVRYIGSGAVNSEGSSYVVGVLVDLTSIGDDQGLVPCRVSGWLRGHEYSAVSTSAVYHRVNAEFVVQGGPFVVDSFDEIPTSGANTLQILKIPATDFATGQYTWLGARAHIEGELPGQIPVTYCRYNDPLSGDPVTGDCLVLPSNWDANNWQGNATSYSYESHRWNEVVGLTGGRQYMVGHAVSQESINGFPNVDGAIDVEILTRQEYAFDPYR